MISDNLGSESKIFWLVPSCYHYSGCHLLIFCQLEGGQNNLWPRVVCGSTQFLFFSLVKNSRARKKNITWQPTKKRGRQREKPCGGKKHLWDFRRCQLIFFGRKSRATAVTGAFSPFPQLLLFSTGGAPTSFVGGNGG